jgi:hypothetical protein
MDLGLTQEETALQARARVFACDVARPRAAAIDRDEQYPWDIVKALADAGYCGVTSTLVASKMLGWKLPQTRDGYTPKPSMRDAAE